MATRRTAVPPHKHSDPSTIGPDERRLELREYRVCDLQPPTSPAVVGAVLSQTREGPEIEHALTQDSQVLQ